MKKTILFVLMLFSVQLFAKEYKDEDEIIKHAVAALENQDFEKLKEILCYNMIDNENETKIRNVIDMFKSHINNRKINFVEIGEKIKLGTSVCSFMLIVRFTATNEIDNFLFMRLYYEKYRKGWLMTNINANTDINLIRPNMK